MSRYHEFYVIQPGDTVSGVFMNLYGFTRNEIARYLPGIAQNNPHIPDLNRVRPGQFLYVGLQSTEPTSFGSHHVSDMNALEREYRSLSEPQKAFLRENPHVVTTILTTLRDGTISGADATAYTIGQLVQNYRDEVAKYGRELAKNYAQNARGTLQWEIRNMILNRRPVQDALSKIPQFLQRRFVEEAGKVTTPFNFKQGNVMGEVRKVVRLSPKSLSGYNPFSNVISRYGNVVRHAGNAGKLFSVAIPTSIAVYDSYQAYGTPEFSRVSARGAGNVAGGLAGSAVGYFACNLVFGAPSAGTSLFWCAIVAGGAAGMVMGQGGSMLGEKIHDKVMGAATDVESDVCRIPPVK